MTACYSHLFCFHDCYESINLVCFKLVSLFLSLTIDSVLYQITLHTTDLLISISSDILQVNWEITVLSSEISLFYSWKQPCKNSITFKNFNFILFAFYENITFSPLKVRNPEKQFHCLSHKALIIWKCIHLFPWRWRKNHFVNFLCDFEIK